jgi:hypothetical protein
MPYTHEGNMGRKSRFVVDRTVTYKDRPGAGRFKALQLRKAAPATA